MLNSNVKQRGYSLIELVITIIISAIVVTAFLTLFSSVQLKSTEPVFQVKAAELGQAYLEEIALKKYDHQSPSGNTVRCNESGPACSGTLGLDGAETRVNFNDIDDYNNLTNDPPIDALGNVRSGFNNFSVSISVEYAGDDIGLAAQDMKRIEVTVTAPDSTRYVFSQYRGNF